MSITRSHDNTATNFFNDMPIDIIMHILSYLNSADRKSAKKVSKVFKSIFDNYAEKIMADAVELSHFNQHLIAKFAADIENFKRQNGTTLIRHPNVSRSRLATNYAQGVLVLSGIYKAFEIGYDQGNIFLMISSVIMIAIAAAMYVYIIDTENMMRSLSLVNARDHMAVDAILTNNKDLLDGLTAQGIQSEFRHVIFDDLVKALNSLLAETKDNAKFFHNKITQVTHHRMFSRQTALMINDSETVIKDLADEMELSGTDTKKQRRLQLVTSTFNLWFKNKNNAQQSKPHHDAVIDIHDDELARTIKKTQ